jgi:phage shock protein PspC (stress-responsive transcriptional regulator)
MKKTLNINLGGIIFHIDEDAFDKLKHYLSNVKTYYKNEEGCEEIVSDIEARIAEIIQERKIRIIGLAAVDAVIKIMGEPEKHEQEEAASQSNNETKSPKTKKRIYRNKEHAIVGGVCSGISSYFSVDPIVIRLLAVVSLLTGGGLLFYLILWSIIPAATTTAQKLQMNGETVNASNIKKTIQKEFENLKESVDNLNKENHYIKLKNGFQKLISLGLNLIEYFFKFIGKFIGIIFLIIGISMCFFISTSLFGSGSSLININGYDVSGLNLQQFFPMIFNGSQLSSLTIIGLILFLGIPVVQLIWIAIRILFSMPKRTGTTKIVLIGFWLLGIVSLVHVASKTISNFTHNSHVSSKQVLEVKNDTVNLEMLDNLFFDTEQFTTHYFFDEELEAMLSTDVSIGIEKSETDLYELEVIKRANGASKKQAKVIANKIEYDFVLSENTVKFSQYLALKAEQGFRFQEIELVLYIPEGKTIYLDNSLKNVVYTLENIAAFYDRKMVNHYWEMTNGKLKCKDCT